MTPSDRFLAKVCVCDHTYARHPWEGNPGRPGWCLDCPCRLRQDREMKAEAARMMALREDPSHVHGERSTAIACPPGRVFEVCVECGAEVP